MSSLPPEHDSKPSIDCSLLSGPMPDEYLLQPPDIQALVENALAKSDKRFRSIIDATPMGVHLYRLDGDDRLVFCGANPAADAILQMDHQKFIGKTLEETFPPLADTNIPQLYQKICSEGISWQEGQVDYANGHVKGSYEVHAFQTAPGMMASMFMDVTERIKTQEALRKSEERLRSFFQSSAAGIGLTSPQGKFLQVNPTACRLLGYTEEEFLQFYVMDITHPDDRDLVRNQFSELVAGARHVLDYENRYLHRDGSVIWGRSIASCVRDEDGKPLYIAGQVVDITDRKNAEFELQSTNRQLQNIIEFLPDATMVIDCDKKVVAWNREIEKLTGVAKASILGRSNYAEILTGSSDPILIDRLDEELPEATAPYDFIKREGETLFAERYLDTLRNGAGAYLWIKASPLRDTNGEIVGGIESMRDITARKQAEEQLINANRDLDAFVYTVSHDLRSPLTPIMGYSEYLQQNYREQLDEQALTCIESIHKAGQNMLAIMSDLLDLATIRKVERPERPSPTRSIVEYIVGGVTAQLVQVGATVRIEHLPSVWVPDSMLTLLFENLIGNAIRYACAEGGVITVGGGNSDGFTRFFVRDHGPGIPEEDRGRIFDVFYRGTTGTKHKGTGIGLATVQKIAKLFGGRAWYDATPGGGSTFWVELKNVYAEDPA